MKPPGRVSLPVLRDPLEGALRRDGSRVAMMPADVHGRFDTRRKVVFAMLITLWASLPWLRVGGNPAVFLDIEHRRFYLFGLTFNAQDVWLLFFLVTGVGFGLAYATALLGRAWCGWTCPQTVFLEGVYRRFERLILGSRDTRTRAARSPLTLSRALRYGLLHLVYVVISIGVAHVFLSYFVSLPVMFRMVRASPGAHPEAFAWALALTLVFYGNFAWFREQLCLVVCPYGRLQSSLLDNDSLIVGYDTTRGEPRGKPSDASAGACVDCKRCIVVCPTGIDIRNGLQMDCLACTACIDACDEVMDKLGRPRGLIRYDSLNGLEGRQKRIVRPRIALYTALLVVGAVVATTAFARRSDLEATLLRLPGAPYVVERGTIRNAFELHIVNKRPTRETFVLGPAMDLPSEVELVIPIRELTLEPMGSQRVPVFAIVPESASIRNLTVRVEIRRPSSPLGTAGARVATGAFLRPNP